MRSCCRGEERRLADPGGALEHDDPVCTGVQLVERPIDGGEDIGTSNERRAARHVSSRGGTDERLDRREALARDAREEASHELRQVLVARGQTRDERRRVTTLLVLRGFAATTKRRTPRQELEDERAEGVKIARRRDDAAKLLRRSVRERPREAPRVLAERARKAEVEEDRPSVWTHPHVGGLHVAMHKARCVYELEHREELLEDGAHATRRRFVDPDGGCGDRGSLLSERVGARRFRPSSGAAPGREVLTVDELHAEAPVVAEREEVVELW